MKGTKEKEEQRALFFSFFFFIVVFLFFFCLLRSRSFFWLQDGPLFKAWPSPSLFFACIFLHTDPCMHQPVDGHIIYTYIYIIFVSCTPYVYKEAARVCLRVSISVEAATYIKKRLYSSIYSKVYFRAMMIGWCLAWEP